MAKGFNQAVISADFIPVIQDTTSFNLNIHLWKIIMIYLLKKK
jgi:hypothetical protein